VAAAEPRAAEAPRGDGLSARRLGYSSEEKPLGAYLAATAVYSGALAGLLAVVQKRRGAPRIGLGDFLLLATASHKLSRTIAKEKVAAPLRAPFTELQGPGAPAEVEERPRGTGVRRMIGELLVCPYCLVQWVATAFFGAFAFWPRVTRFVAQIFAAVSVADFLHILYKGSEERLL
jgi:Protein of unknown function (DUF1360)